MSSYYRLGSAEQLRDGGGIQICSAQFSRRPLEGSRWPGGRFSSTCSVSSTCWAEPPASATIPPFPPTPLVHFSPTSAPGIVVSSLPSPVLLKILEFSVVWVGWIGWQKLVQGEHRNTSDGSSFDRCDQHHRCEDWGRLLISHSDSNGCTNQSFTLNYNTSSLFLQPNEEDDFRESGTHSASRYRANYKTELIQSWYVS